MTAICDWCGSDTEKDKVIERDGFRIDPRGVIEFEGRAVRMRRSWRVILASLAKAWPRPLSNNALIERIGIEGLGALASLRTQISSLRVYLRKLRIPQPVKTIWGEGYVWSIEARP